MTERIEWIETVERLEAVAAPWDALVADEPTPFTDHGWFRCWWDAFGGDGALKVCALWRDDELAAVLPLVARGRHLASLANYHSPVYHAPARDRAALDRVVDAVLGTAPDDLRLHGVPVSDVTIDGIRAASSRHRRLVLREPQHVSPLVDTRGDFGEYARARKSKLSSLLRRRRKVRREHDVRFELDGATPDLETALDTGFRLEAVDWKLARGTAITSSPQTLSFYRAIAAAYSARGELRLAWLHIDGRPAAFCLLLQRGARLFLLKTGFDAGLRNAAPGLILTLDIIESCFEDGWDAYELLGEKDPWKQMFATDERSHERIWSFRLAPRPLGKYAFRRVGLPAVRAYSRRRQELQGGRSAG